jgi:hypothetical protein
MTQETPQEHPLQYVFNAVVDQAMHGKGVRHGGCEVLFYDQPWRQIADDCGEGFLMGQCIKKAREAQRRWRKGELSKEAYLIEIFGALAYGAMAALHVTGNPKSMTDFAKSAHQNNPAIEYFKKLGEN